MINFPIINFPSIVATNTATNCNITSRYSFTADMPMVAHHVQDRHAEVEQTQPENNAWLLVGWAILHHLTLGGNPHLGNTTFILNLLPNLKQVFEIDVREVNLVQLHLADYYQGGLYLPTGTDRPGVRGEKFYGEVMDNYLNRRMACMFNMDVVCIFLSYTYIFLSSTCIYFIHSIFSYIQFFNSIQLYNMPRKRFPVLQRRSWKGRSFFLS